MKKVKHYTLAFIILLFSAGCDKDFIEVNTNPYAVTSIDPALLFAGAQRTHLGTWAAEHTIVQQFVCPYNTGANLGFNFNVDDDLMSNPKWNDSYPATVRNMMQALSILGETTDRVNLKSMIRIWKANLFMGIVDTYGDVPYFEAGRAVSDGIFYPVYDDDEAIYDDIYNELTSAMSSMDPAGDYVSADLFYGVNAQALTETGNAADQVAKWRKLGNSILLRLGMRYTKFNQTKAESIVAEAFAGGVMTSNADIAYVKYDGSLYLYNDNNGLRNFSQFNCAAEPFVDQLKSTNDPRGKFILAFYADPGQVVNDADPDTVLANQFGVPIGISSDILATDPNYRGTRGTGLNYSQFNIYSVGSPAAPAFYVTYAQTCLLLAEAAHRGWVSGTAQTYYENGIRADMEMYALYPNTTPITDSEMDTYLANPAVAFDPADALELINTQYWVVSIRNGTEAFSNFRRTGFPVLSPNLSNNNLQGGFARRMSYPDAESSANDVNYEAATASMGGDNQLSRVFWDVP